MNAKERAERLADELLGHVAMPIDVERIASHLEEYRREEMRERDEALEHCAQMADAALAGEGLGSHRHALIAIRSTARKPLATPLPGEGVASTAALSCTCHIAAGGSLCPLHE